MKNKVLKRVLSVLLCVCVFCCSFSLTAFAVNPVFSSIVSWVIDELKGAAWDAIISNIEHNTDPDVILENKARFVATLRDFAQRHNMDYDTAYEWLVDCISDGPDNDYMTAKYGENWGEMHSKMHEPVAQLCNNYIYQMDIATLAQLVTEKESTSAPVITEDDKVQIPAKDFNNFVDKSNTLYTPKNATGKMSYWTDEMWHNYYDKNFASVYKKYGYNEWSLYTERDGFSAVGGGNEIYLIPFYNDGEKTMYSKYQLHFTVEKVGETFNFKGEFWDNIEGSQSNSSVASNREGLTCGNFRLLTEGYYNYTFDTAVLQYDTYTDYVNFKGKYEYIDPGDASMSPAFSLKPDYADLFVFYDPETLMSIDGTGVTYDNFNTPPCNPDPSKDIGYVASVTPIVTIYNIQTQKIPDNYYITIGGDTVYDYSITNPETGQTDTVNNYITNNYTYVTNNNPSESGGSGGGVGGNVTVGGNIGVSGSVGVDINVSVPDININVNESNVGGGENLGDYVDPSGAEVDVGGAISKIPELSKGFVDYLKGFFAWLPAEIYGLIILLLFVSIWRAIIRR